MWLTSAEGVCLAMRADRAALLATRTDRASAALVRAAVRAREGRGRRPCLAPGGGAADSSAFTSVAAAASESDAHPKSCTRKDRCLEGTDSADVLPQELSAYP